MYSCFIVYVSCEVVLPPLLPSYFPPSSPLLEAIPTAGEVVEAQCEGWGDIWYLASVISKPAKLGHLCVNWDGESSYSEVKLAMCRRPSAPVPLSAAGAVFLQLPGCMASKVENLDTAFQNLRILALDALLHKRGEVILSLVAMASTVPANSAVVCQHTRARS